MAIDVTDTDEQDPVDILGRAVQDALALVEASRRLEGEQDGALAEHVLAMFLQGLVANAVLARLLGPSLEELTHHPHSEVEDSADRVLTTLAIDQATGWRTWERVWRMLTRMEQGPPTGGGPGQAPDPGPRNSPLMTSAETAEYLRIPLKTLYALRAKGTGPPGVRIGKHVMYRRADVDDYLDEQTQDG